MRKVDELRNVIANQFAYEYKAYELKGYAMHMGFNRMKGLIQCIVSGCMF